MNERIVLYTRDVLYLKTWRFFNIFVKNFQLFVAFNSNSTYAQWYLVRNELPSFEIHTTKKRKIKTVGELVRLKNCLWQCKWRRRSEPRKAHIYPWNLEKRKTTASNLNRVDDARRKMSPMLGKLETFMCKFLRKNGRIVEKRKNTRCVVCERKMS